MSDILGASPLAFVVVSVIMAGGVSVMMGQALADGWKPAWQGIAYGALLGLGVRFLLYALADGTLLSVTGYAASTAIIVAITLATYRIAWTRKMVNQYPWAYERRGLFFITDKSKVSPSSHN